MGDPRLPRRVWKKPKRPLNYDLKMSELKTLGEFGLKTKRELWKAHTELSRLRNQARSILALGQDVRQNKEPILIRSLVKVGLVPENSTLDDVLNLQVVDMLSRRLQTIVMKNLGFKTSSSVEFSGTSPTLTSERIRIGSLFCRTSCPSASMERAWFLSRESSVCAFQSSLFVFRPNSPKVFSSLIFKS